MENGIEKKKKKKKKKSTIESSNSVREKNEKRRREADERRCIMRRYATTHAPIVQLPPFLSSAYSSLPPSLPPCPARPLRTKE